MNKMDDESKNTSVFNIFIEIGIVLPLIICFIFGFISMVNWALMFAGVFLIFVGIGAVYGAAKSLSVIHAIPFFYISVVGILIDAYVINKLYYHYNISENMYWLIAYSQVLVIGVLLIIIPYTSYADDRIRCSELVEARCVRVEKRRNSNNGNLYSRSGVFTYYPVYSYEYHGVTYECNKKFGFSDYLTGRERAYSYLGNRMKIWINPDKPQHTCNRSFKGQALIIMGAILVVMSGYLIGRMYFG